MYINYSIVFPVQRGQVAAQTFVTTMEHDPNHTATCLESSIDVIIYARLDHGFGRNDVTGYLQ
jgi:hypothetical protein